MPLLEPRERSQGSPLPPSRCLGREVGPPPPRRAAPAHAPSGVLPAPPAPGRSEAPREEFQPFPLRRAVCGVLAARPQRSPEVGAGRRGPVTSRVRQLPGPRCPARDSRPAAPRPGHQTGLSSSPGLCGAPGLGSSPRGRRRRLLLPAPRGRPPAFCVPAAPPPRSPPTLGTPPESEFETEVGTCCVTFRQVPSPF